MQRGAYNYQSIIDVLYREKHIVCNPSYYTMTDVDDADKHMPRVQNLMEANAAQDARIMVTQEMKRKVISPLVSRAPSPQGALRTTIMAAPTMMRVAPSAKKKTSFRRRSHTTGDINTTGPRGEISSKNGTTMAMVMEDGRSVILS